MRMCVCVVKLPGRVISRCWLVGDDIVGCLAADVEPGCCKCNADVVAVANDDDDADDDCPVAGAVAGACCWRSHCYDCHRHQRFRC